jgi:hypothetical protein
MKHRLPKSFDHIISALTVTKNFTKPLPTREAPTREAQGSPDSLSPLLYTLL